MNTSHLSSGSFIQLLSKYNLTLILTLFTLIPLLSSGQLVEYALDSNISVRLPAHYQVLDTLGQRIATAQTDNGLLFVSIMKNDGLHATTIRERNSLPAAYRNFQTGIIESQKGTLHSEELITRPDSVIIKSFAYYHPQDIQHLRYFQFFFLDNAWYGLQYWDFNGSIASAAERDELFSSLQIIAKNKSQINSAESSSSSYLAGKIFAQVFIVLFLLGIPAGIFFLIIKLLKGKRTRSGINPAGPDLPSN